MLGYQILQGSYYRRVSRKQHRTAYTSTIFNNCNIWFFLVIKISRSYLSRSSIYRILAIHRSDLFFHEI